MNDAFIIDPDDEPTMERDEALGLADLAPRVRVIYTCDNGHAFAIPMAAEAEPPIMWTCRCGSDASRPGFARPEAKEVRTPRSHYEILCERRSPAFLEKLLGEELAALRHANGSKRTRRAS